MSADPSDRQHRRRRSTTSAVRDSFSDRISTGQSHPETAATNDKSNGATIIHCELTLSHSRSIAPSSTAICSILQQLHVASDKQPAKFYNTGNARLPLLPFVADVLDNLLTCQDVVDFTQAFDFLDLFYNLLRLCCTESYTTSSQQIDESGV